MWGIVWQEELPQWQAPDSRFVDFMVTSFKVTTGWNMPSDNLFECWLWKALNISASYHDYRICSSICEGLSSSLLIFYQFSAPIPSFLRGNSPGILWKYIMQRNLVPRMNSSPSSCTCLRCYAVSLPFEPTSWDRDLGHFSRHLQATHVKKASNVSKLQSAVRCIHMNTAPFILYMLTWENKKFKHPKVTFPCILWLHFFLILTVRSKTNWIIPMTWRQILSMHHASITFQLELWVREWPFSLSKAKTF